MCPVALDLWGADGIGTASAPVIRPLTRQDVKTLVES
jgi:hypothetical protein